MKIAIQGHLFRGEEVIQILKSLGGINKAPLIGDVPELYYYIDNKYNIIHCHDRNYVNKYCKKYTLEEFEKEFPFKIGDKVIKKNDGKIGTIIKRYNPYMWGEMWTYDILYMVKFNDDPMPHRCSVEELKPYKEMKEERNITLTLDKAKEWYNKGGELKEIALQAFTEKELNSLPKSWEEYCMTHGCICLSARYTKISTKYDALLKLEQLRDCWRQGWKPKTHESVYTIKFSNGGLRVYYFSSREFLSFPTKEMAEEFFECFRDLIEKAGDLI